MKVKLIKDHALGKAGSVIDVSEERAAYLIRLKAAVEVVNEINETEVIEKPEPQPKKEKFEFIPFPEKEVHTGLPVGTKKRERKKKTD